MGRGQQKKKKLVLQNFFIKKKNLFLLFFKLKTTDQKSEYLKVWVKSKNKNLMGIAQKLRIGQKKNLKIEPKFF
jgi:hypothetical protein